MMNQDQITHWIAFLQKAVSPYHSVAAAEEMLEAAGFQRLSQEDIWKLEQGGRYYVNLYGTSLAAFRVGEQCGPEDGFRIAGSHTDWPGFRVKPAAETAAAGCVKLNVEPYGSPIYSSWMDRPLSMAGRICVKGENLFHPKTMLVNFTDPMLVIPSLAIHFNREVNKGVPLNPAKDMQPLLGMIQDSLEADGLIYRLLEKETGVPAEWILNFDLYIYNWEAPVLTGPRKEFISSPRLDNQTSVYAGLMGITQEQRRRRGIDLAVLYDNEEIGNKTKQGAESQTLLRVMEKIAGGLGFDRAAFLAMLSRSFLLSCDVAHALHPNYTQMYDEQNRIQMGQGVGLKWNFSQKYATDIRASAIIQQLMEEQQIPYRKYLNRSDLPGGGTLGSAVSALLGIPAVDVGAPILSMHSAREMMAVEDQDSLNRLLCGFFAAEEK